MSLLGLKRERAKASFVAISMLVTLLASPVHAENYVMGVAACPPWKHGADTEATERMLEMCPRDLDKMLDALGQRFSVDDENIIKLLQEDATPENMYRALQQLEAVLSAGDTLFLFQMTHGGIVPYNYMGYNTSGEIFALYTEQMPENVSAAVQNGYWASARDLRDAISVLGNSTGANIVVMIEACHSEAAGHEIIHNPLLNLGGSDRISYIFSAKADQTATFNDDASGARFTEEFVTALLAAQRGTTLDEVFSVARGRTHRGALAACMSKDPAELKELYGSARAFFENCTQEPAFVDPRGLLLDVTVE